MVYKIDLLNSICTDNLGGTGGHVQNITALNEWCVLAGGTGGHRFDISAYNELSTLYGGTGWYKYDIDALNEICVLSGGTGGHRFAVDALVELGALLNLLPVIPDGTPTSTFDVTDTAFKVISSVSTNSSTVVELEYGTATGVYTNTVTAAESPVLATGDVNFALTGLTPFTNYYFRVKAENSAGIAYSQEFVQRTTEPAIISDGNTVAWYDYTDASTITKDGSNFVSQWRSRIGTNHLNQAVGTNQPLLTADGVLFDGVDNFMKTAAFTFNQPEFIYLVINQKSHGIAKYLMDGASALNTGGLEQNGSSGQFRARIGSVIGGFVISTLNTYVIVKYFINGANSKLQVNNSASVTFSESITNMGGVTIGCRRDAVLFSNIEVKEIILRKVADNSTDEASIFNYLKTKYGL